MKRLNISLKIFLIITFLFTIVSCSQQRIEAVKSVNIIVSDMNIAIPFYSNVLHFNVLADDTIKSEQYSKLTKINDAKIRIAKLKLGDEKINLIDFLNVDGKPYPNDSRSNDLWFQHIAVITNNMDSAYAWLKLNKVKNISVKPQRLPDWNKNAGGIKAFYFQDTDGHPLEILEFPKDKGNKKWHQKSNKLFLGIDHTAIAVSSTKESLKFYRDLLGMNVAGESENYGIEQAILNNVEDAHLQITGLKTDSGIGIEFLEYLSPKNGRAYPSNAKSSDLYHWIIEVSVEGNINSLYKKIIDKGYITYSPVINAFKQQNINFNSAFIVIDPDGHRLLITK